jgi:hypothetical protein
MSLPASFKDYQTAADILRTRRLMIGTEGVSDSGKSEFALSAPGPGIALCLDRAIDGVLQNPDPPPTRHPDWVFKIIKVPLATQTNQAGYLEYWKAFYAEYLKALDNKDARSILLDGDSDSWELQRLAELGKLTQVMPIMYTQANAARRAMIARAWDSGKIVIATNKIGRKYEDVFNADGTPQMGNDGKQVREFKGNMKRQGFADQDYLWQIQLRHTYRPPTTVMIKGQPKEIPKTWGVKITKCKANKELEGTELWGEDCNFQSLVQLVYPQVPLKEWGYK